MILGRTITNRNDVRQLKETYIPKIILATFKQCKDQNIIIIILKVFCLFYLLERKFPVTHLKNIGVILHFHSQTGSNAHPVSSIKCNRSIIVLIMFIINHSVPCDHSEEINFSFCSLVNVQHSVCYKNVLVLLLKISLVASILYFR